MPLWRAKPRKTPYGNAVRVLTVYAANFKSVTLRHTSNRLTTQLSGKRVLLRFYRRKDEIYMAIVKKGISIDSELLKDIDVAMKKTGYNSRSAFICNAVKTYIYWVDSDEALDIITPTLEKIVADRIQHAEDHLARVIYKDAVSTAMMMHVMAECYEIYAPRLNEIRSVCIQEINHLKGKFKFEDAVYYEG